MRKHAQQFFLRLFVVILRKAKAVAAGLQTADCFLEGFLVGFSDAHDLANRAHLCAELVFHAFEFLEGPAREFDYDIVAVRHILVKRAVFAALDLF